MLIRSMDRAWPGQHLCQVCDGEQELQAAIGEFVRSGLAAQALIILVTGSAATSVGSALLAAGVECDEALERGQLRILSVADGGPDGQGIPVAGVIGRLETILEGRAADGYAVARMASEVDSLYGVETAEEMLTRERLGGDLIAAHPMVGLCLYDRRRHDLDFLTRAGAEHGGQLVTAGETYRDEIAAFGRLGGGLGLWVSGQLDLSNCDAWAEALDQVVGAAEGDVLVDVSDLSYVDVGGLRALAETARRHPGRRLVLVGPTSLVLRMLALTGWDTVPNLVVHAGDERP